MPGGFDFCRTQRAEWPSRSTGAKGSSAPSALPLKQANLRLQWRFRRCQRYGPLLSLEGSLRLPSRLLCKRGTSDVPQTPSIEPYAPSTR